MVKGEVNASLVPILKYEAYKIFYFLIFLVLQ